MSSMVTNNNICATELCVKLSDSMIIDRQTNFVFVAQSVTTYVHL